MSATEYVVWRQDPSAADQDRSRSASNRLTFGDDIVYIDDQREASTRGRAERLAEGVSLTRLHLVVQVGNRFEAEHPDAQIVYRKGRYLLVDLDPQEARARARTGCYAIQPIQGPQTVYQERQRVGRRARARADIQELVDRVSGPRLKAAVQDFVDFQTRHSTSQNFRHAADAAKSALEDAGCEVQLREVSLPGGQRTCNVIGSRRGNGPSPRGAVVVTAHLDSVNHETAGGSAPGADDNGSGSAGVLEIATCLADRQPKDDLHFILFGGEEQGLFGSIAHVAALPSGHGIRAVVNMDMIATINGTASPTVLIEGAPVSQALIDSLATAADTYTGLTVQTSLHAFNSDHVPFIEAGIPAVLLIEGNDSANTEVHTARDTIERLNVDLMEDIVRLPVAFVAEAVGLSS